MQQHPPHARRLTLRLVPLLFALVGCGGGAGDAPPSASAPRSTRLADNPLRTGVSFDNFTQQRVTLDPSGYATLGQRCFLKLSRGDGATLYLGEVERNRPFTLTVDTRLDDTRLDYELFTENPADPPQRGEIAL